MCANRRGRWELFGLLFFLSLIHGGVLKYSQRTVRTAYGELRGIVYPKGGNLVQDVEGFLGIPYASPPAASLRFMPPLTPSRWSGVKVADKMGPVCPQILPEVANRSEALSKIPLLKFTRVLEMLKALTNQSEDCLYLNIYMPYRDSRGRGYPSSGVGVGDGGDPGGDNPSSTHHVAGGLAVVVILQGESWEWGSGNLIDGSTLAAHGHVMVITLNYRLNVLGFLQTSTQQGNYALMDVVAALHWIRENAGAFGADINKITVLGHKAGAVLANFLMLAPVSSELFHRVILLSGSALSPWSLQRQAKSNVRKVSENFKCLKDKPGSFSLFSPSHNQRGPPSFSSVSAMALKSPVLPPGPSPPSPDTLPDVGPCLRLLSLQELLSTTNQLLISPRFLSRFGPLIENSVVKTDFVQEMKFDSSGRFGRFPLLIGTTTVESFGELNTEDIEDGLSEGKRDRILRTFVRNVFIFHLNEIYSTIKNEYTDWEKPRKDFIDVRDSILNILSDGLTVAPLIQVASMHSSKASAKTFLFHFQYEPDRSVYPNRIGSISEDLLEFAVGKPLDELVSDDDSIPSSSDPDTLADQLNLRDVERSLPLPPYSPNDAKVSKNLMHYLANFIISGDPNSGYDGSSVEDAQLPFWDSYDPINQFYLEMDSGEPRMKGHYRGHKMALWLNLIPQLHQSGGPEVAMIHHNFRDERPESYDGVVREQSKTYHSGDDLLSYPAAGSTGGGGGPTSSKSSLAGSRESSLLPKHIPEDLDDEGDDQDGDYGDQDEKEKVRGKKYPTLSPAVMSTSECPPNTTNATTSLGGGEGGSVDGSSPSSSGDRDLMRQLAAAHYHSYGTALGVTIGVGVCLLLLNLLIFLAIYHHKTHNMPPPLGETHHHHLHKDEENPHHHPHPHPHPHFSSASLGRVRSHPDLNRYGGGVPTSGSLHRKGHCGHPHHPTSSSGQAASTSVSRLYNDDDVGMTDDYDEEDIVHELRECTGGGGGGGGSHSHSHSSFRGMNTSNKELSSSSGFSSPSIPDPPPPPRAVSSGAVTFASLTRGSVRVLRREEKDFTGTC